MFISTNVTFSELTLQKDQSKKNIHLKNKFFLKSKKKKKKPCILEMQILILIRRKFWNYLDLTYVDNKLNITSFSSISYWSNSEYWPQKCAQSGNIHSIILDVHVGRQSAKNFPFNPLQCKLNSRSCLSYPEKLVRNLYCTGTI